jgi:hypothetical protein
MFAKKTITVALAALFVASFAFPTAAAEPRDPRDIETGNDTVDCIIQHLFSGWYIGNCLEAPSSTGGPGETIDCVYEHLKAGWFVGNCL